MGDWTSEFNAVFFAGIATTVFIFLGTLVKYGFRSKCDSIKLCCGLVEVHRRVELEQADTNSDEEKKNNV